MKSTLFKAMAIIMGMIMSFPLVSCGDDNKDPNVPMKSDVPQFSGLINPQSRAFDQSWESGDGIGITGTSGDKTYTNVQFTTDGTGNFTVADVTAQIYFQNDDEVTFTAYYPYGDSATFSFIADTRLQDLQKDCDFLWAQAKGSIANPVVTFAFTHRMAKVVLTVKKGSDVSFDEVKAAVMSLGGFRNNGVFNAVDGIATATGEAVTAWQFSKNTGDAANNNAPVVTDDAAQTVSYTMILYPQTFDAPLPVSAHVPGKQTFSATLDFTNANQGGGDAEAKNEWVAGRQYNMSLTLNKTNLKVESCTIAPWNGVNGGNVDAD